MTFAGVARPVPGTIALASVASCGPCALARVASCGHMVRELLDLLLAAARPDLGTIALAGVASCGPCALACVASCGHMVRGPWTFRYTRPAPWYHCTRWRGLLRSLCASLCGLLWSYGTRVRYCHCVSSSRGSLAAR